MTKMLLQKISALEGTPVPAGQSVAEEGSGKIVAVSMSQPTSNQVATHAESLGGHAPSFESDSRSEIVFLGTGSSAGTPMISCLMNPDSECTACRSAAADGQLSKNARGNPSLLICKRSPRDGGDGAGHDTKWIVIDVGKTFKSAACRFFPRHGVRDVHAVVVTHEHADAMLGLDDMRETKAWGKDWRNSMDSIPPTPVYLSDATYKHVQGVFPYLIPKPKSEGKEKDEDKPQVVRMVSQLEYKIIAPFDTFYPVEGFEMRALPTVHGSDCCCLGFEFGKRQRVIYLSDFNILPEETFSAVQAKHVDVLIIDCLRKEADTATHIGLPTAIKIAQRIKATRTLLVGLSHSFGDHEENNRELRERPDLCGLDIQLAFDGQSIKLDL